MELVNGVSCWSEKAVPLRGWVASRVTACREREAGGKDGMQCLSCTCTGKPPLFQPAGSVVFLPAHNPALSSVLIPFLLFLLGWCCLQSMANPGQPGPRHFIITLTNNPSVQLKPGWELLIRFRHASCFTA